MLHALLRFYKRCLSPIMGDHCRFYPSCSQYFMDSIVKFGAVKGILMGLWRIIRCNPLSPGGYDPVFNNK